MLSLLLASTLLGPLPPLTADAAVQRPFNAVYQSDGTGYCRHRAMNNVATVEPRRARDLAETSGPAPGAGLAGLLLAGAGAHLLIRRRSGPPRS